MNSRQGGPQSRPRRFGEYRNISLLPKLESVAILPSLSRYPYRFGVPWAVTVEEDVARGGGGGQGIVTQHRVIPKTVIFELS
jgi:hypothetical protein